MSNLSSFSKTLFLIAICSLAFSSSWTEEIVRLKNEKKVILKDNKTWAYVEDWAEKEKRLQRN